MKNKSLLNLMLCLAILSFQSCVVMSSASISNVQATSGKEATASVGGLGILHLTAPRDIAQRAAEELRQKGVTGNISTTLTMRDWFIVQSYRIVATGKTDK